MELLKHAPMAMPIAIINKCYYTCILVWILVGLFSIFTQQSSFIQILINILLLEPSYVSRPVQRDIHLYHPFYVADFDQMYVY